MFWGSFCGKYSKGPGLFWEKSWGTISSGTYCQRIVPLIHEYLWTHPDLIFIQDEARSHTARATIKDLQERGITVICWPPYSPNLNPIESLWDEMKDWIQDHYSERMSLSTLRTAVQKAWDAIRYNYLNKLIDEMPQRCQAVIDAEGKQTKHWFQNNRIPLLKYFYCFLVPTITGLAPC